MDTTNLRIALQAAPLAGNACGTQIYGVGATNRRHLMDALQRLEDFELAEQDELEPF